MCHPPTNVIRDGKEATETRFARSSRTDTATSTWCPLDWLNLGITFGCFLFCVMFGNISWQMQTGPNEANRDRGLTSHQGDPTLTSYARSASCRVRTEGVTNGTNVPIPEPLQGDPPQAIQPMPQQASSFVPGVHWTPQGQHLNNLLNMQSFKKANNLWIISPSLHALIPFLSQHFSKPAATFERGIFITLFPSMRIQM